MRKSWRELRRHKEGRVLPRIVSQTPKAMSWCWAIFLYIYLFDDLNKNVGPTE
jgi:hypothetical protein